MSRLELLLNQTESLEPHERSDLKNWLQTLQSDCETFGETAEDRQRMDRIRRAIAVPAEEIVVVLRKQRFRLDNEKLLQSQVEAVLEQASIPAQREARLGPGDIVDFLAGDVAIECKIKGQRRAIYRQCERYCGFEAVGSLILLTNAAMGMPPELCGKPVYFVDLGRGWL